MTRTSLPRPTLLPGLCRLWRDPHTLQLGLDPARAVLLELPDPRAAQLLDLLDGTRPERLIVAHGGRLGLAAEQTRELLDALRAAGLVIGGPALLPGHLPDAVRRRLWPEAAALALHPAGRTDTPAQVLRRRAAARVVLTGRGRLAAPVAVALAHSGVGHVRPDLPGQVTAAEAAGGPLTPANLHQSRATAVAEAVTRAVPGTQVGPVRRGHADIVVLLAPDRPAALLATAYAQRRQAHLVLAVRDGTAVVGPLVTPGGSPCLNCLDQHRRDRDPAWPTLAAQLAPDTGEQTEACAAPTLLAAAAYAAAEVLDYLDAGTAQTIGAALEISAPGRTRRRTWPPHPNCSCRRPGNKSVIRPKPVARGVHHALSPVETSRRR